MTTVVPVESIVSKIVLVRGEKVIIDRDLSELYDVETKQLKRAVRRNINRFPEDFMFQLTKEEYRSLRSQFGTLKRGTHSKYPPMAFTEQGIAMLSSVLNSDRAIEVNIAIMRAFVKLREMMATHSDLKRKIESMEKKYDEQFQIVFEAIKQLLSEEDKPKKKIGYTVKEKQKAYGKSVKNKKPSPNGTFTPKAKKIWEAIPGIIQFKILNNAWCVQCRKESSIGNLSGKIESGMLVLRGTCTKCGGDVARVIENE